MSGRPDFRYLIKYGKDRDLRFISHLDLLRTWERLLRRADLPLAYTEGYNPRVKMSFGQPLPLGFVSQAEYLELYLKQLLPTSRLFDRLAAATLPSLPVLEVTAWPAHWPSIMAAAKQLTYRVELAGPVAPAELQQIEQRLRQLLDSRTLIIRRTRKQGVQEIDLRPYLASLSVEVDPTPALHMSFLVRDKSVSPREVLPLLPEIKAGQVCRLEQVLRK